MSETSLIINVVNEQATDSGNGLTFMLHGVDAQATPTPVVYVDGAAAADYTFDAGDTDTAASIVFGASKSGKTVTCDYSWRLTCSAEQDMTVYELGRESNTKVMKDVNGRTMAVESCEKVTGWQGQLVWDYADQTFWEEIRRIAETPGTTFDVVRGSLTSPLDRISNLFPTGHPKFREIPGVPGRTQVLLAAVQLG